LALALPHPRRPMATIRSSRSPPVPTTSLGV